VAQQHLVAIDERLRQDRHPVEMCRHKLPIVDPIDGQARSAQLHQPPILVAAGRRKAARHQQIGRARRIERPADMIAQVHHLADAERRDIRQHRLQRSDIAVHVRNRREFHAARF
jgi:hypothetical protein